MNGKKTQKAINYELWQKAWIKKYKNYLRHKCNIQQHLLQTLKFIGPVRHGQEPQSSCPNWLLPLVLGSGGGDWKDKGHGEDWEVGASSSSTGTRPRTDSPEGDPWAAWYLCEAWDWGGTWLWLWVCWRMFRHSPRQLRVAADVALSSSRSWSRQERGPLVGRESMDWTRFFCWPSAWDITWGTTAIYGIKIHSQQLLISIWFLSCPVNAFSSYPQLDSTPQCIINNHFEDREEVWEVNINIAQSMHNSQYIISCYNINLNSAFIPHSTLT